MVANILSRVQNDYSTTYKNFPQKYTLNNENLLKLYIVKPKSLITKFSFVYYVFQIIVFFTIVSFSLFCTFNITQWYANYFELFIKIIIGAEVLGYLAFSIIDRVIHFVVKN